MFQDQPSHAFYGVFDGHGGVDAANYAASHMCSNIVRQKSFDTDITDALQEGFRKTDKNFVQKAKLDVSLITKHQ